MTSKISEKKNSRCGSYEPWTQMWVKKDIVLNLFIFSIPIDQAVYTDKKNK